MYLRLRVPLVGVVCGLTTTDPTPGSGQNSLHLEVTGSRDVSSQDEEEGNGNYDCGGGVDDTCLGFRLRGSRPSTVISNPW